MKFQILGLKVQVKANHEPKTPLLLHRDEAHKALMEQRIKVREALIVAADQSEVELAQKMIMKKNWKMKMLKMKTTMEVLVIFQVNQK